MTCVGPGCSFPRAARWRCNMVGTDWWWWRGGGGVLFCRATGQRTMAQRPVFLFSRPQFHCILLNGHFHHPSHLIPHTLPPARLAPPPYIAAGRSRPCRKGGPANQNKPRVAVRSILQRSPQGPLPCLVSAGCAGRSDRLEPGS